eukprot:705928-Amphidinium_carterae.1
MAALQIILMGNGDGRVCGYAGFDPKVERALAALIHVCGCDFLIMPSRYEPCGIPYAQTAHGAMLAI